MTNDLFDDVPQNEDANEAIAPGAVLLHGFAVGHSNSLLTAFNEITPGLQLVLKQPLLLAPGMQLCGRHGMRLVQCKQALGRAPRLGR